MTVISISGEAVAGRVVLLEGAGPGVDVEEFDVARAEPQRHQAECASPRERFEDPAATDQLWIAEHTVEDRILGTAQGEDSVRASPHEGGGVNHQTVSESEDPTVSVLGAAPTQAIRDSAHRGLSSSVDWDGPSPTEESYHGRWIEAWPGSWGVCHRIACRLSLSVRYPGPSLK